MHAYFPGEPNAHVSRVVYNGQISVCIPFMFGSRARARQHQALVSLNLKKSIDAEGGSTFAVIIEGG